MPNGVLKKGRPPEELPVAEIKPRPIKPRPEEELSSVASFTERPMEMSPKEEVLEYPLVTKRLRVSWLWVILGIAVLAGIIITFGIYVARKPEEIVPREAVFEAPTMAFLEQDKDNDGLTTLEEMKAGTDPENSDADRDGLPDGWEVEYILDPLLAADAMIDKDWDGLTNLEEYNYKGDPLNPDTDGDGYTDGNEINKGFNPAGPGKLPQGVPQKEVKPETRAENIILIGAEGFSPSSLTVSKDTTVVWVNQNIKAHQVMGGILDSGPLKPGHSWQYTFEKEGTYNYFDAFDIEMRGKVVVE